MELACPETIGVFILFVVKVLHARFILFVYLMLKYL